jgi:uncharacterized protein YegL
MPKAKKPSSSTTSTLVTFLLDRSGSMKSCQASTIEAFNGYVDGLRDVSGIDFTLVLFDHHMGQPCLEKVCVAVPVKTAPEISEKNYVPRGSTPLIDAAYTVIKAVETSLERYPGDTKVVICIQTDGQENSSWTYGWEQLSALIKQKQDLGWQFNFMGAGIDAYQQGAKMGLSAAQTVSYDHTSRQHTNSTFRGRAAATMAYASGQSATMSFSDDEKLAAGDKFYNAPTPPVLKPRSAGISVATANGGFLSLDLSTPEAKAPPKPEFKL